MKSEVTVRVYRVYKVTVDGDPDFIQENYPHYGSSLNKFSRDKINYPWLFADHISEKCVLIEAEPVTKKAELKLLQLEGNKC